jgi:hypothetical protein
MPAAHYPLPFIILPRPTNVQCTKRLAYRILLACQTCLQDIASLPICQAQVSTCTCMRITFRHTQSGEKMSPETPVSTSNTCGGLRAWSFARALMFCALLAGPLSDCFVGQCLTKASFSYTSPTIYEPLLDRFPNLSRSHHQNHFLQTLLVVRTFLEHPPNIFRTQSRSLSKSMFRT